MGVKQLARNSYDHFHIYKALNADHKSYRCMVEGCPHIISFSMLMGRKAGCSTCEGTFTVLKEHNRRTNLTCIGCGITPGLKRTETNPLKKKATMESILAHAKKIMAQIPLVKGDDEF